jgi:GDP-4-dehydro-6-deoxy-D-mannose reductase
MDTLAAQYVASYKLKIVITRAFNHSGTGRGDVFVDSNFAKQIATIEKGLSEPVIRHGNLEAYRDFTDVDDICRAYIVAVEKCDYGTPYNICSGNKIKIADVLTELIDMAEVPIKTEVDPERMRPSDLWILQGDSTKFRYKTGWSPLKNYEQTLNDMLKYWRERA